MLSKAIFAKKSPDNYTF